MAEALPVLPTSVDSYLRFPVQEPGVDTRAIFTAPSSVEDIIAAARDMLASEQTLLDSGERVQPGSPRAVALAIASIRGYDAPPTPHARFEDDDTLGIQQEVLRRISGVLDNPVLTIVDERQRLQELREQSEIGTRMFRTLYLAVLQKRRVVARVALTPEIAQ